MQFTKDQTPDAHLITGIDTRSVRIDEQIYAHSLIVCASEIIEPWPVHHVGMLDAGTWRTVIETQPELILLGTGTALVFPQPHQLRATAELGIGVEVMDTEAACRTYNLLVHENRRVTAALIFQE